MTEMDRSLRPYLSMLERIRKFESFHERTNQALEHHPYLQAAKNGSLTLAQRRAFCCEQFSIQHSDACSFAKLAGHDNFSCQRLVEAVLPEKVDDKDDLFHFLLGGELYASKLLIQHAASLGLDGEDQIVQAYQVTAEGQGYPSYWSRLALNRQHGAAAAACAVNFPAWGNMCRHLLQALKEGDYGYTSADDDALAFIQFFATPIENLDEMAAKIMHREKVEYEDIVTAVRLLQEYEVLFWDAAYKAK
mmetsp:Transcript_24800/g.36703  ORF Transcript_24800/g.36703 Transcript_24800/m.36703 type:complete len:248 (+) Transcript_24800:62-805(+)